MSAGLERRKARSAILAGLAALGMVGLGFASVPLYNLFCSVTGFDGTTQRVSEAQAATIRASGDSMTIRFDANHAANLPWDFKPAQATDTVAIGARDMAIYVAHNNSDRAVTGTAAFNVTPVQAGKYFNKIQCFCFTEQTLAAGESVRMPVLYYVDPAILDDPDTRDIEEITLSYTFFPVDRDEG